MKRIIVLGGEGMLGHKMFQTLSERFPDTKCTIVKSLSDSFYSGIDLFQQQSVIQNVDATDLPSLRKMLREHRPDVIVNCIGMIKQRDESTNAILSITLNSLLPHELAAVASEWGGRVFHFSTDCVFNGRRGKYTESDPSDAEDFYGKTKYLGEITNMPNAVTLRTSIIGRELSHFKSLLEWVLSQQGRKVQGYTRHFYSGVTTNYLSRIVAELIAHKPELSGLYQVTSTTISKHDLLILLRDAFKLDIEIVPEDEQFCDRSMIGDRFDSATGFVCPSWPELAAELANDPTPYAKWRQQA